MKNQLINKKGVTKKCSLYILRLLAGKLEKICTAFPLATFSAKNSKWLPLKFSRQNHASKVSCKKIENKTPIWSYTLKNPKQYFS